MSKQVCTSGQCSSLFLLLHKVTILRVLATEIFSCGLTAADAATVLNPGGTAAANGDFVATWKDKSGNGADATQTTSGIQPVYWTNQLNGSGAIIFTTEGQYLTGPTGAYQTVLSTRAVNGFG